MRRGRTALLVLVVAVCWPYDLSAARQAQVQPGVGLDSAAGKRWAIIVGISVYPSFRGADLPHASDDAKLFRDALVKFDSGLDDKKVQLLLGSEATLDRIREAFGGLRRLKEPPDVVYFYFAGHGWGDEIDGYLFPSDIKPDRPIDTSLSLRELGGILDSIRANSIVLIVDAAHQFNFGSVLKLSRTSENRIVERFKTLSRGLGGVTLIAPPSVGEPSGEDQVGKDGWFTNQLVRGMQGEADRNGDGKVLVSELAIYMRQRVAPRTSDQQTSKTVNGGNESTGQRGNESTGQRGNESINPQSAIRNPQSETQPVENPVSTRGQTTTVTERQLSTPTEPSPTVHTESQPTPPGKTTVSTPDQPVNPPASQPNESTGQRVNESTGSLTHLPIDPLTVESGGTTTRLAAEALIKEASDIVQRISTANPPTESEWQKASEDYVKVARAWPEEKNRWLSRAAYCSAQARLTRNDRAGALAFLKQAVELDANFREARYELGDVYLALSQFESAAREFQFITTTFGKNDFDAYARLALAYQRLGQFDKAEPAYRRALQLKANEPTVYYSLGLLYYSANNYPAAIEQYDTALKLNPNGAEVYYARGLAYDRQKNYQQAIADYQRALELDPTSAAAGFDPNLLRQRIQELKNRRAQ